MTFNEEHIRKVIMPKKGVVGYSKKIRKRIRNGVEVDEDVLTIYVDKKRSYVSASDLVPLSVDNIPTDVVEIGKVEAANVYDGTCRPLVGGYSIANRNGTAGTLGYYFSKGGEVFLGSNTHVLSDTLRPNAGMKAIVQPGPSDGGTEIVAYLVWHAPLMRSLNGLSALLMIIANAIAVAMGKDPPFDLTDSEPRQLDFAVARPISSIDICLSIPGLSDFDDFCGVAFATSTTKSFFCKEKYVKQEGYLPYNKNSKAAEIGDIIHKVGRTSGYTSGAVLDDSAYIKVNYSGDILRHMNDVIMTEKIVDRGDSGSAGWLQATLDV